MLDDGSLLVLNSFQELNQFVSVPENQEKGSILQYLSILARITIHSLEEMFGEILTADLEQLTTNVQLLAKVFWLCMCHTYYYTISKIMLSCW